MSQQREISKIDSLLDLNQEYAWSNRLKALSYAKDASLIAEKIDNSEKKAYSYVYMAKTLGYLGLTNESFTYLEKAKKERYFKKDKVLQALVKEETSVNFGKLGLFAEVLNENLSILTLVANENTPLASRIKFRAYGNIAATYMNMGDYKKAVEWMKKEEKYSKEPLLLKTRHIKAAFSNLSANKGYVYLNYFKKNDSALFYFNKSLAVIANEKGETKAYIYRAFGDYYFKQKQYNLSLSYYIKSLEDIESRKIEMAELRVSLYDNIAKIYGILGEKEKQNVFLEKYNKENEKATKLNPISVRKAVSVILSDNKSNISRENNTAKLLFVLLFSVTAIASFIFYRYKSKQNKLLLQQKDVRLSEKNHLISEFEAETDYLKKKIHFTIDELINLAKKNDSNFYSNFIDTFPHFEKILLDISPSLKSSDFLLLAYIYLNFDTKQIADILFKSVRTIQNKKYALRKKLGISTNEDLYIWLKTRYNS